MKGGLLSAEICESVIAQKVAYQNGQDGSFKAIKSGEIEVRTSELSAIQYADARWRIIPVATLRTIPSRTSGVNRKDVCIADRFWTFWKLHLTLDLAGLGCKCSTY